MSLDKPACKVIFALCMLVTGAWPDSLELKNGSLINGKFVGATENEINFQVGSSVKEYKTSDVISIKFDSENDSTDALKRRTRGDARSYKNTLPTYITVPAGTRISIRTVDAIDSTKNHVGDRFQATLEEAIVVNENVVVPKGSDVYGRLAESKESGKFTGRSELKLELTGIVVNGVTIPITTGEYELTGKSRGASTAKRTVGGAAVGSIIGAIAGGGKGAAIGAGAGAGVGAASEIITKGDQVKIPSETLLDFTLSQDLSIPSSAGV
ncbi:MAG TPA: hypothetical protein VG498_01570 [Terriglobales bacterium]|nr:hypothetical protein [Terriglobales bacterium]